MMKAAEATDGLRSAGKLADDKKGVRAGAAPHTDSDARRPQVLTNLMQTGGVKSKCAPLSSSGNMELRRRRCSCTELHYLPSNNVAPHGSNFNHSNYTSCNCNMENCASEAEGLNPSAEKAANSFKSQPWRSSSDQSNTNAALHRALAAMKKVSGEPDAVKKAPPKPPHPHDHHRSCASQCESDVNARLITNSDARTLSMRERGRWGNSKMQQQLFVQPACNAGCGGGQHAKANLSSEHQHQQPLQHVQCLHCGSFSTTPMAGVAKGVRSQSFGRIKVRDYSWQQELLQEQKRPEQQVTKEVLGGRPPQSGQPGGQISAAMLHHRCEYARCADMVPEYEAGASLRQHMQAGGNVMSWQERYMLLCQAIAAGAFVDGGADDMMSGPILPASRGYSWAVCECAACQLGSAAGAAGGFRQAPPGYCNTRSGERMMELEAFSGPLGYVSESKAGTELNSIMEKRPPRRRWWARLPSFAKSKSGSFTQTAAAAGKAASGQNTAQCSSCGQRVWARGEEEEELGGRLCPDCLVRTGGDRCQSGPIPGPATAARPTPPRAARPRPPPAFSSQQKHLPRRWRLMKLCRYLMGFPLQR